MAYSVDRVSNLVLKYLLRKKGEQSKFIGIPVDALYSKLELSKKIHPHDFNLVIERLESDSLIFFIGDTNIQTSRKVINISANGMLKAQNKIKKFLYNPWTVRIGGGVILLLLGLLLKCKIG